MNNQFLVLFSAEIKKKVEQVIKWWKLKEITPPSENFFKVV
jgi:hypothetical protein